MLSKKVWIPAALCLLVLTACSPVERAGGLITDRVIQVKRYPDQQRPSVGYASAFLGYKWKKGGETEPRQAWENVPEAESMGDPNEIDISPKQTYSYSWSGPKHKISGKSLSSIAKRAAGYEYKHLVEDVHVDAELNENGYALGSFPYVYKGEKYMGIILAKHEGDTYIYQSLNFSHDLKDGDKILPFVPGNGSMGIRGKENEFFDWTGGSVNDERIREIVMHFEDGTRQIPIAEDQITYLIPTERDRDIQYIEGLDQDGKSLYTWQF
ncbi:hypothetical protein [Saccharibacillus kuerlensis]|uniref:Lipoprotein n=1 Tax=Saccharibacillus kuerlensis TaxID=459527 RepID=A0ABQ2KVA4_9BACL|nr:hypothetical protein [Saccharibacillus kuerlensis]GGN93505.1 hypothetical protein GCM10010969_07330 [Saccharibacillus kuerlensis]